MNALVLVALPGVITVSGPLVADVGIVAWMAVSDLTVKVALVPTPAGFANPDRSGDQVRPVASLAGGRSGPPENRQLARLRLAEERPVVAAE